MYGQVDVDRVNTLTVMIPNYCQLSIVLVLTIMFNYRWIFRSMIWDYIHFSERIQNIYIHR